MSKSVLDTLEKNLNDIFDKNAPPLPDEARRLVVRYLPYVILILGFLSLLAAWSLWNAAHTVNTLIDYTNGLSAAYSSTKVSANHVTFAVWLALAVLTVEALLYITAYPGTKARKKSGWNLLYYALIINVVYGVVAIFTDYGGIGQLIMSLIGSIIGAYFLFQIRDSYTGRESTRAATKKK